MEKNQTKHYNDITKFKNLPLAYLLLKFKEELEDSGYVSSHIKESDLNQIVWIEIYTLNRENPQPHPLSKEELLKKMINDWVDHL